MTARLHHRIATLTLFAGLLGFAALATPHAVAQSVIYVSAAATGAGNGSSWADAYQTVQPALNAAQPADQVWVAAGRYVGCITLKEGVALYGGFAGTEDPTTFDLATRNFIAHETILDGNRAGSVVTAPSGATSACRIDGFTITGGKATYGGGVYLESCSPTIANNAIVNNKASSEGGGLYLASSAPTIVSNTVTANSAAYQGAGLSLHGSTPTIANNAITNNTTPYYGGGLFLFSCSPVITNNRIVGNSALYGGALLLSESSPTIANNAITDNSAKYYGAALYLSSSSPIIANNTLTRNEVPDDGGTLYLYDSYATIANTIVALNTSGLVVQDTCLPALRHNCVYGNASSNYSGLPDPTGTSGNISADPHLAASPYGGWHLPPDSPCIDAGSNADALGLTDLDTQPRILGAAVDIGADESDGTIPPTGPYVIVRVSPTGDDAADGASWSSAKRTVQAAITAAATLGGEVWVQAGTYYECISLTRLVHVYGGFAGTETARDQRNWHARTTTLDAQQRASVVLGGQGYPGTSTLDGFTITHGRAANGGGIRLTYSSPTIAHNTIVDNTATSYGGGLYVISPAPTITDNVIVGNAAPYGSGLFLSMTAAQLLNNTIAANTGTGGAGLYLSESFGTTIRENVIADNAATVGGGGMCVDNAIATIVNNTITRNRAGTSGGGVELGTDNSPLLANNLIAANTVTSGFGGGLCLRSCSPTLVNNTVVGNTATTGGGLCLHSSVPTIVNTIVAFNSSGLYAFGANPPTLRFNCVYGNAAYDYSGLTDPSGTDGNISADPLFADPNYGNFHLQTGSSCLDAGASEFAYGTTDVDGQLRTQSGAVDIGADESDGSVWPPGPYAVIRVSPAGNDTCDGSTWALAKRTIRAGIAATARLGGEIWVQGGTYYERITLPPFAHVYGGFAGTEQTRNERNWSTNVTTLDGQQQGSVVTAVAGQRVSTLDGFTITHGNASSGGGLYLLNSSPALANNAITANSASVSGGGLFLTGASPTLANMTITTNTASGGGGLYATGAAPTLTNSTISANTATSGAGVFLAGNSAATLIGNRIAGNTAASSGAGVCISSSAPTLASNLLSGNTAASSGGGLALYSSAPTLTNNTIVSNVAPSGGGLSLNDSAPSIASTIVAFNSSGVMREGPGTSTLRANCVFGNTAYNYSGLADPTGTNGNLSVDPLFVLNPDPNAPDSTGNLHLQALSPCINAGSTVDVWGSTDLDGFARIVGSAVDLGAYEYPGPFLGDLNGDSFINAADFALFTRCFTGPDNDAALSRNCRSSDLDADADGDLADFARLQQFAD